MQTVFVKRTPGVNIHNALEVRISEVIQRLHALHGDIWILVERDLDSPYKAVANIYTADDIAPVALPEPTR